MEEIIEKINCNKKFQEILKNIKQKTSPITLLGLSDYAKTYIPCIVKKEIKEPICIITYNELQAKAILENAKKFDLNVIYFPKREIVTYEYEAQSKEILYERIEKIKKVINKELDILIISIETFMQPTISKEELLEKEYKIENIKKTLVNLGYERCDLIEGIGQFSIRGGIIDISQTESRAVRIELWGDEVDSIRYFNISSQRSIENIQEIEIYPATEEVEEPSGSIIEYISEDYTIFLDEIKKIEIRANNIINDNNLIIKTLIEKEKNVPKVLENIHSFDEIIDKISYTQKIYLEKQDIITGRENAFLFSIDEIKEIDEIFSSKINNETKKPKRRLSKEFQEGEKVVYQDLKIGDYVVHKISGIGQFIGVNTIKADSVTKDYIKIKYKDDDILYIPTDAMDNIRKYIGSGEAAPKLNRLGSKEWINTKAKVKTNLREVARNLIELYAKRQKIRGYAFSKDTIWQQEFEDKFPYVETDDQLRCIEEVKKDMEQEKPMDRLLCGDVGYGKTEIALRGAFKACMDQKQVAYLAPTTILANQQYETFKDRVKDYPIRVELLNRFKTKKEQEEIVKKVKLGEIDILIGTHRILSKDVEFKDLGLLIVDEEHRFGVKDKEKIKELKANIDVLTMTATPIPRTLHMSIVGVRDMSVIYKPPQNRKPVNTYVLEYDKEVIKEAITKELERDGQVFYLYNFVENIEKKAKEIEELVPEANVAFAHGKMSGNDIEQIMLDFINKKTNVIVCTTILESGIDIPNANTIIVENADRLGLAQLYQIRGRVGRSDKQSYAYITYKRDKLLSEVAEKRLRAIKEFTEFGSGFKIAMRDLEIRGAGSILRRISTWTYGKSWIRYIL